MKDRKAGDISLTELLEAGCHFGHVSRRWQPKMSSFVYAKRDNIHIFDLVKTREGLMKACDYVRSSVASGKRVWFVGTKRQGQAIVKEEAERAGAPFVTTRWLGGTITNWKQIKKSIDKLKKMKEGKETGEYDKFTKFENVQIDREISKLERFLGGIQDEPKPPDVLFVLDAHREKAAVSEAKQKEITIVAIVDSNTDPTGIDYVIPANDDAVRSIKLLMSEIGQAYLEGVELRKKGVKLAEALKDKQATPDLPAGKKKDKSEKSEKKQPVAQPRKIDPRAIPRPAGEKLKPVTKPKEKAKSATKINKSVAKKEEAKKPVKKESKDK